MGSFGVVWVGSGVVCGTNAERRLAPVAFYDRWITTEPKVSDAVVAELANAAGLVGSRYEAPLNR